MILSRAPVRITLGGGGTDLESFYSKHGGFLIAAGIDKYCNIIAHRRFYSSIRLSYSETELKERVADIEHRIFRVTLEFLGIDGQINLHSIADVPAGCGLGTSSSFTVALVNALHAYKREYVTQRQLAEEACHIEIDLLGEPIGKQDQYAAAFGGITCFTFDKNGDVLAEPLNVRQELVDQLETNLLLFFTGKERKSSEVLAEQDRRSRDDDPEMTDSLLEIKEIGLETRRCLEAGQPDALGELLHVHWQSKKRRSENMSDPFIDECYEAARKSGAGGGKLVGAGGGGFLMFYCDSGHKTALIETMRKRQLRWERFRFDHEGAKVLINA